MGKLKGLKISDKVFGRKVGASTLPEVLIAMIIIMSVFTIAITIYSRITVSGVSVTNTQVQGIMTQMIFTAVETNNWKEENVTLDSIYYQKTLSPYKDFKDLFIFQVTAKQEQKIIGSMRQILKRESVE